MTMDVTATSLTPAEWLNQQFASSEARENAEGFAGRLLISLQHQMYRAQQGIDDSCSELLSMRSSISHDVANIRTHSGYLNKDLSDLHSHLGDTCGTANESIEKIRATEVVKQRMELTYRSLENQDNWEALLVNIKEFMANGDLEAISGRLSALQKCFVSLGDSAEHEQRRVQLDDVKNSVESFLIPRLVSGLSATSPWKNSSSSMRHSAGSEGLALKIVHIFNLMERTETLKRILRDCRQRQFIARWEELLKTSQDDIGSISLEESIGNFYEDISSSWHNQLPLYAAAYPDPANALLQSCTSILSELGPKLEEEMELARKKSSESAASSQDFLSGLLALKRSQEAFCQAMEREYQQNQPKNSTLSDFNVAVRKPLENALSHYTDVEMVIISAELTRSQLSLVEKAKSLHALLGSATRLSSAFYSAIVRCFELTEGQALRPLVASVNEVVAEHVKKVSNFASELKTAAFQTRGKTSDFTDADCEALNDLVKVLQHCGDLVLQLENIDDLLLQDKIQADPVDQRIFASSIFVVEEIANSMFQWVFALPLQPVEVLLEGVTGLSAWSSSAAKSGVADIPSFGFDPQEYITRIGNYLLTLPQIIDPVLSSESPSMKRLKTILVFHGIPPPDESTSLAEAWIQATVYQSMLIVTSVLTRTKHLTSFGIRHMMADLRYLQNVVDDFAVPLSDAFAALIDLLSCSYEDFLVKVDNSPPLIVAFVKRARNFD